MDETLTHDVAAWLYGLVAGMTITVGHPNAEPTAAMAWEAMSQLESILKESAND